MEIIIPSNNPVSNSLLDIILILNLIKMRFTIILALCTIAIVSASSLNKRSLFDDSQNSSDDSVSVSKRYVNPFQMVSDLKDPVKFAQDFLQTLADLALKGRLKRDIQENLEKFNELTQTKSQEAFQNIQKALEQLLKKNPFFQSIFNQFNDKDSTKNSLSKRDAPWDNKNCGY